MLSLERATTSKRRLWAGIFSSPAFSESIKIGAFLFIASFASFLPVAGRRKCKSEPKWKCIITGVLRNDELLRPRQRCPPEQKWNRRGVRPADAEEKQNSSNRPKWSPDGWNATFMEPIDSAAQNKRIHLATRWFFILFSTFILVSFDFTRFLFCDYLSPLRTVYLFSKNINERL